MIERGKRRYTHWTMHRRDGLISLPYLGSAIVWRRVRFALTRPGPYRRRLSFTPYRPKWMWRL